VDDASAIEFAREFYRHVVLGKSVGAAKNLAANKLAEQDKPGTTKVELKGEGTLLLADGLAAGERPGRVEDGMPLKGSLPGTAFFAGRHDEFTEIAATLGDTEQVAYGLWGIGGIGKTALTLELARRNAWRYQGGIAWVDARDVSPPTAAGMLQFALAELEPASTAKDAASGLVRLMKEAPVLVVLDNLETLPSDEHQVLSRFLKKLPRNGSRVLVTARSVLRDFDDVPGTRSRTLTTGLDEYSAAHHAFYYARLKDVKALCEEYPRVTKGGAGGGEVRLGRPAAVGASSDDRAGRGRRQSRLGGVGEVPEDALRRPGRAVTKAPGDWAEADSPGRAGAAELPAFLRVGEVHARGVGGRGRSGRASELPKRRGAGTDCRGKCR